MQAGPGPAPAVRVLSEAGYTVTAAVQVGGGMMIFVEADQ